MRWKIFPLVAVLALMVSTMPPMKVAAQGLVEYALILVVVGMGNGETAEIYLARQDRGDSEVPPSAPGDTPIFTYVVTNTGDATCTQTIEGAGPTSAVFGLPIPATTVSKGFGFVTVGGGEPIELKNCFKEDLQSQRVAIQVSITGGDRGFKFPENNSPFPTTVPIGVGRLKALGNSIYKTSTGETVASAVREVVPDGFVQTFPPSLPVP